MRLSTDSTASPSSDASARATGAARGVRRPVSRRGLSLIEMMIALTISATLMSATLAALDAMFKGYKQTTESASTHVISRIVMSRLVGMVRTGTGFSPVPASVLDEDQNPLAADYFQFVTARDAANNPTQVDRIEYRYPASALVEDPDLDNPPHRTWDPQETLDEDHWPADPGELWYVREDLTTSPPTIVRESQLLSGIRLSVFTLRYERGPRLARATFDLLIEPNDSVDLTVGTAGDSSTAQTFRMVATAAPRIDPM